MYSPFPPIPNKRRQSEKQTDGTVLRERVHLGGEIEGRRGETLDSW